MISSGYSLEDIHEILDKDLEHLIHYNRDIDTLAENIKCVEGILWNLERIVRERK